MCPGDDIHDVDRLVSVVGDQQQVGWVTGRSGGWWSCEGQVPGCTQPRITPKVEQALGRQDAHKGQAITFLFRTITRTHTDSSWWPAPAPARHQPFEGIAVFCHTDLRPIIAIETQRGQPGGGGVFLLLKLGLPGYVQQPDGLEKALDGHTRPKPRGARANDVQGGHVGIGTQDPRADAAPPPVWVCAIDPHFARCQSR